MTLTTLGSEVVLCATVILSYGSTLLTVDHNSVIKGRTVMTDKLSSVSWEYDRLWQMAVSY